MIMRLKIIDVNFTNDHDWVFKLQDEKGNHFFIMNQLFYKAHGLKSPITKKELDSYDKGQWINVILKEVAGKIIVIDL